MEMKVVEGKFGLKYKIIGKYDLISKHVEMLGEFEPDMVAIADSLLQHNAGDILDIGANMGTFTMPIARGYPERHVYAIEVQPKVFNQLLDNLEINKLNNVTSCFFGLSDKEEVIQAVAPDYDTETNIGAFSLDDEVRKHDYESFTRGGNIQCHLYTMDSQFFKNIGLIKIDVEGMELKVLKGGVKTIEENNFPPIIFEGWTWKEWFAPRLSDLLSYVESLGYVIQQKENNFIAQHKSRTPYLQFSWNQ